MATNNIYSFNALTGGVNDGYLDYLPVANLADGDFAFGIVAGLKLNYSYVAANFDSENSPYVIIPDDNTSGTGAWVLINPAGAFSHVSVSLSADQLMVNAKYAVMSFNVKDYDVLNEFNTTTNLFTAKYAGYYDVKLFASTAYVPWTTGGSGIAVFYIRHQNNTVVNSAEYTDTNISKRIHIQMSKTIYLAAGETISCGANIVRTSAGTYIDSNTHYTYMTIDRLA